MSARNFDYYFTDIARNQFFENNGNGTFTNKAPELGLEDTYAAVGEFHKIKQTEVREGITTGPGVTHNGFEINYNPATEEITIRYAGLQFQQVELLVSDVMGRVMIRKKLPKASTILGSILFYMD
ncbi:MAG: hypothetical protein H6557_01915 [Lewinellaceae bacterium]|nr:hypothetical protein [Phaeodactylibacter sp.]MCB9035354.1 hypothetical protein [Lewinellaceae bacterium]